MLTHMHIWSQICIYAGTIKYMLIGTISSSIFAYMINICIYGTMCAYRAKYMQIYGTMFACMRSCVNIRAYACIYADMRGNTRQCAHIRALACTYADMRAYTRQCGYI